ncbi:MAG: hypothetical protein JNM43_25090 [Planctomycetaceae bacterium]|nr:hypothetical protein [Planctomycetaceae bacterium]
MSSPLSKAASERFPDVGRTLFRVGGLACLVGLYSIIPSACMHFGILKSLSEMPSEIPAALTVVLGWLLVFRTNTSYARWWEARTLWGSLTNTIRNLAIKFATLTPMNEHERRQVRSALARFPVVLKDHLRGSTTSDDLDSLPESVTTATHKPTALTETLYRKLQFWKESGGMDSTTLLVMDEDLRKLLEITGGCERIQNTRLVRSYRGFARQSVALYLATLPWGLASDFGWWTIPLTAALSYFMLGLETVAEHIEQPFGTDDDDLDLDGMCRNIRASVESVLYHS